MKYENNEIYEQVVRQVSSIGNGAHIFAPKEWLGEKIILIRTYKKSLKEKILKILDPYLENIIGVYVYGSYARKEESKDSDIDILVISNKKINIKNKKFEIITLEEKDIQKAINISPVLIYSAISEAKTIINPKLLEELKVKYKPKIKDFKEYLKETKNIIKINEELLDTYSIILRLRGIFLIKQLLSSEKGSIEKFKEWIIKKIPDLDFDSAYESYIKEKRGLRVKNLNEDSLKSLLQLLKDEVNILENSYGEKRKKT